MTEKQWDEFFDLMEEVTNLSGLSANERGAEIRTQALHRGKDGVLDEFAMNALDDGSDSMDSDLEPDAPGGDLDT